MDYAKIYDKFIADRKSKLKPEGYTERHHIVPRALGGGNEPENLIDLTAEDHFFAHLLLARIYGGAMWAPVAFMIGGVRKGWRARKSRISYGWAKRALARNISGENSHQFDWEIYELWHKDGRTWKGRQSDMTELGMSKSLANMLIKGRVKTSLGWFLSGQPVPSRSGANHHMYNHDVLLFRHVDGREFRGTSFELAESQGLSQNKLSEVRAGKQRCHKGWYVDGRPPHPTGRGLKLSNSYAGKKIKIIHLDGRVFYGSAREAAEKFNLSIGNLNMVINGKRAITKGWKSAS